MVAPRPRASVAQRGEAAVRKPAAPSDGPKPSPVAHQGWNEERSGEDQGPREAWKGRNSKAVKSCRGKLVRDGKRNALPLALDFWSQYGWSWEPTGTSGSRGVPFRDQEQGCRSADRYPTSLVLAMVMMDLLPGTVEFRTSPALTRCTEKIDLLDVFTVPFWNPACSVVDNIHEARVLRTSLTSIRAFQCSDFRTDIVQ